MKAMINDIPCQRNELHGKPSRGRGHLMLGSHSRLNKPKSTWRGYYDPSSS